MVAVGSKYSADHEVQWRTSVRSPGANDSTSNQTLDLVEPVCRIEHANLAESLGVDSRGALSQTLSIFS